MDKKCNEYNRSFIIALRWDSWDEEFYEVENERKDDPKGDISEWNDEQAQKIPQHVLLGGGGRCWGDFHVLLCHTVGED